jgi:uncharacterized protein (TIGR03083 family)
VSERAIVDLLTDCFDSIDGLLDGLSDEQWGTQSLCPAWTVRGVVTHLGAIEHMLCGLDPGALAEGVPFARAGEWMASVEGLNHADLLARYREVIAQRRVELRSLAPADFDREGMTPVGPGTYGRFMSIRVFDLWAHEHDIRVPLGLPGHEGGPAAEAAIGEIEGSLPYIIGKKVQLPDGKGITIELTGPVVRTFHVVVDGRAKRVDTLDAADVVVRTDSMTFALLACGRIDPQGPIDDGRVTWTGDALLGEAAARNLAFTM